MRKLTLSLRNIGTVAALLVLTGATHQALAQGNPGSGGPAPTPPAPTSVPLDGGISLLLAGGVALGVRKLRQR